MIKMVYIDPEALVNIEYGGRTAWNSHDKRDKKNPNDFITHLVGMGHESVIEHSYCILQFDFSRNPELELAVYRSIIPTYDLENKAKDINYTGPIDLVKDDFDEFTYARFNFRALKAFMRNMNRELCKMERPRIDWVKTVKKHVPFGILADMNGYLDFTYFLRDVQAAIVEANPDAKKVQINSTYRAFCYFIKYGKLNPEYVFSNWEPAYEDYFADRIENGFKVITWDNKVKYRMSCGTMLEFKGCEEAFMAIFDSAKYPASIRGMSYVYGTGKKLYVHHDLAELDRTSLKFGRKFNICQENIYPLFALTVSFVMSNFDSEQLLRNRGFSPTKQSGRFIDGGKMMRNYKPRAKGISDVDLSAKTFNINGIEISVEDYNTLSYGLYRALQGEGCKRQEARAVTPYSQMREIVISGNLLMFRHWLKLRVGKEVQPSHSEMANTLGAYIKGFKNLEGLLDGIELRNDAIIED